LLRASDQFFDIASAYADDTAANTLRRQLTAFYPVADCLFADAENGGGFRDGDKGA
jgi:hypothetical protein